MLILGINYSDIIKSLTFILFYYAKNESSTAASILFPLHLFCSYIFQSKASYSSFIKQCFFVYYFFIHHSHCCWYKFFSPNALFGRGLKVRHLQTHCKAFSRFLWNNPLFNQIYLVSSKYFNYFRIRVHW